MSQLPSMEEARGAILAEQLREMAADGRRLDVAQFQFVGFDEIARAYGERWRQQKERVKDVAHAFIKRRLSEGDLLVRAADGFVIVYAEIEGLAARSHAEEVKTDLNVFYLGEGATRPPAQVAVRHAKLPVHELIQAIGEMEFTRASEAMSVDEQLAGIELKYQPMWDAQREAVSKYFVAPTVRETGERVAGYRYDLDCERNFHFPAIDKFVLNQSEIALRKMVREGKQSLLGVSLHYTSLKKVATRVPLCNVIDRFNRDLMRYRVFQIAAAPAGCPRIYLKEIHNALKQRAPKVAISIPLNEPDLRTILEIGPEAVGFTLSPWALGENATVSQQEVLTRTKHAVEAAHAAKVRFFFDGHADATLAKRLREIGVDVICSTSIWPLADAPQSIQAWSSDRLAA